MLVTGLFRFPVFTSSVRSNLLIHLVYWRKSFLVTGMGIRYANFLLRISLYRIYFPDLTFLPGYSFLIFVIFHKILKTLCAENLFLKFYSKSFTIFYKIFENVIESCNFKFLFRSCCPGVWQFLKTVSKVLVPFLVGFFAGLGLVYYLAFRRWALDCLGPSSGLVSG